MTEQNTRLVKLQDDLTKMAYWLHRQHIPDMHPDDILGEMNLALMIRADQDPTFLDQKKAYIISHAVWRARHAATKNRRYTNRRVDYVDDEADPLSYIADTADLDFGLDFQQALAGLSEKTKTIVLLLGQGYRKADIARIMKISAPNVGYHVKRARAHFTKALALA